MSGKTSVSFFYLRLFGSVLVSIWNIRDKPKYAITCLFKSIFTFSVLFCFWAHITWYLKKLSSTSIHEYVMPFSTYGLLRISNKSSCMRLQNSSERGYLFYSAVGFWEVWILKRWLHRFWNRKNRLRPYKHFRGFFTSVIRENHVEDSK